MAQVSNDAGLSVPLDPPDLNTAISEFAAGRSVNVVGASGDLDFDKSTGEAPGPIGIWEVVDGGFQTLQYLSP